VSDFDNVNNLINDPLHQARIAELKSALRKKQLELFDSGLLPENMRLRRAEANNMTIYEMVRDPGLYPLEKYLDFADMVLTRDADNLTTLVKSMSDPDEGIRYWATCGLFLLEEKARPEIAVLEQALEDDCTEVQMMAAWAIHRLGNEELANETFEKLKQVKNKDQPLLESIHRWKDAKHPVNRSVSAIGVKAD